MPIYMDRHNVPGIEAKDAAEAHRQDLKIQDLYACRCMTYWVDEERGNAFCLIDAPNEGAVIKLHEEAHGLLPHEIIQVNSNVVEAFLGRISDPESYSIATGEHLKVFNDPAFRVILKSQTKDQTLLEHRLGVEKAKNLFALNNQIIKEQIKQHEGREVELPYRGFVASFISVSQAIQCAISIQKRMHVASELLDLRIGIHAGVPVHNNDIIFGDTLKFATNLCSIGKGGQIIISSLIHELSKEDPHRSEGRSFIFTFPFHKENFLELLMDSMNDNWENSNLSLDDLCKEMAMSKSQLYRKCIDLFSLSPNEIIKNFRLNKSLELLNTERNIAEVSFDCGFNSASYFTKCFQKQFGLLPMAFLKNKT